jgi:TonB-dependent receptor
LTLGAVVASAALHPAAAFAQTNRTVRVVGVVRDQANAIPLPGVPVEVTGTSQTVFTDVDGRYVLELAPGTHEIKVSMEGYQPAAVRIDATGAERTITADVGLSMSRLTETVNVTANFVTAETSSAAAQLVERRNAQVITDNIGSQEMRQNGDSDAAQAMSRVTGMSLVDNQYVFVRGLGERYSNTTLAGSVLPTTEPDKKVVPLDLFPSGLIDSVQVAKSYSPEKSAEFAGGLVQIVPLKLPNRPAADFSYGVSHYSTATGKDILLSSLGSRDWLGFDNGSRALPSGIPSGKIVRQGIYTPNVGYTSEQITGFGRLFDNQWRPAPAQGAPGQNWGLVLGNRFGNLGVVASVSHSYKEQYVEEQRRFFAVGADAELEEVSDYAMKFGTEKAQLGLVGNISYQFTPNHRLSLENFYSHSGRDEGRYFEGPNTENNFYYKNYRLQFVEEGLMANAVGGEHFFQGLANSRVDWRVNVARASRDEPDLRETLYQGSITASPATRTFTLADESQSGFRLFNTLDDNTVDVTGNWSLFRTAAGRATQFKLGASYVERTRDFQSRRFRFIPIAANKDAAVPANLTLTPEELFTSANIGTAFRLNEETRPVDAYDGDQTVAAGYGMIDIALTYHTRLIAGARVERFEQRVNTFDPFGLFVARVSSENRNTDVFPSVNLVQAISSSANLRVSYSTTVNRPEFRELAEFEFTDIVGNRAVRGNPELERALIHNVDGRWEMFTGARGVLAASAFYKHFDQPIERIVVGGAQPLSTFQNADTARNFGFELEAGQAFGEHFFASANYTYVDSRITLAPEQRAVQTSLERPLAGQSKNLFNLMGEVAAGGFSARVLVNFLGDRISDVGANEAPDIIEQGRAGLDLVFSQRWRGAGIRLNLENLTDSDYLFTQGSGAQEKAQRQFRLGRTIGVSFSYSLF